MVKFSEHQKQNLLIHFMPSHPDNGVFSVGANVDQREPCQVEWSHVLALMQYTDRRERLQI